MNEPAHIETGAGEMPAGTTLTAAQRAAVVLSLLDPETARTLARKFDEGRTERAIDAFRSLGMVSRDELERTVDMFTAALDGDLPVVAGGKRRADDLLQALLAPPEGGGEENGPHEQGSIADGADAAAVWAYIRNLTPEEVAALISQERPGVIAAVLREVDRARAAAVLEALDPLIASSVVRILLKGRPPARRTVDAVAESLRRGAPARLSASAQGGSDSTAMLAAALNAVPAPTQHAILEPIRSDDPEAVRMLEGKLLRFGILHKVLPKTVAPMIFREMDQKLLDTAMKHALAAQPETAEFMLSCISQRLAEQIRERVEELPPVRPEEGERAQAEVVGTLIAWSEEDRFAFKLLDPDED